ncbi:hypothetical protein L1049_026354 [Liquidambar formosana]|uniref:SKI-interacting protein SKIP SNW domain-containing protein n=1 Tax=Liquidambar formosana TaxID=63359 RepID=A0AAP0NET4_LIQFO
MVNSGSKERIVRMVEMPVDNLEPPKFKHKRVPKAPGSPPVPVMHSPPRPVTVKDQQDWKIPPCISKWKNPKGYTIPLDMRLAADGRGLQEKERKEKERKEQELRALAQKARSERTGGAAPAAVPIAPEKSMMDTVDLRGDDYERVREKDKEKDFPKETREEREERLQREKIREERRRERERERRLEAKDAALMGKKSKITRDRDGDIGEKVALGMASTGAGRRGEVMYDERLFNQEKGMDSGFGTDDQYSVYDKGLFTAQPTLSTLYRPKKDVDAEMYGVRDRLVEFEKEEEEADPFGLDQFWTEVKKPWKKRMN